MKLLKHFFTYLLISLLPVVSMASIEVVGSMRHTHTGMQGDVYKGEIKIHNSAEIDQEVKIYQKDLLNNYDSISYDRSNATWIQYGPGNVLLKGNETIFVQYEVTIPQLDSINGIYRSILMVEGVKPIDPLQSGQMNSITINHHAVQVVTEIEDESIGELEFLGISFITEGEKLFLAVDILNKDSHFFVMEASIELFNESGQSIKVIKAHKKGLLPTTSARYRFDLEAIESEETYQTLIISAGRERVKMYLDYNTLCSYRPQHKM